MIGLDSIIISLYVVLVYHHKLWADILHIYNNIPLRIKIPRVIFQINHLEVDNFKFLAVFYTAFD